MLLAAIRGAIGFIIVLCSCFDIEDRRSLMAARAITMRTYLLTSRATKLPESFYPDWTETRLLEIVSSPSFAPAAGMGTIWIISPVARTIKITRNPPKSYPLSTTQQSGHFSLGDPPFSILESPQVVNLCKVSWFWMHMHPHCEKKGLLIHTRKNGQSGCHLPKMTEKALKW